MRAISFLRFLPFFTFFTALFEMPSLKLESNSTFSLSSFSNSLVFFFRRSFNFMMMYYNLATTFVLTGSFVPPLRKISLAVVSSTPSTSKSTLPGLTIAT